MSADLHARAKQIYNAALALTGAERDRFLDTECGEDETLRAEVDSLLQFSAAPSLVVSDELVEDVDAGAAAGAVSAASGFNAGDVFGGRYRIVALLGRGGMGEVYRADDTTLGVEVALKLVTGDGDGNTRALLKEARLGRTVTHPSICRVFDVGEADGRAFITMEFVEGENLARLLTQVGRMTPERVRDLGLRLSEGLAAAHEAGVIHRDLKPSNVMIDTAGRVVITDFGVAAMREDAGRRLVGTPAYMAPELLARRSEADERSDLYALGLILYEALTGQPAAAGSVEELAAARARKPPPPSTLVTGADPALDRIVTDLLEPDPAARPASALEVIDRLSGAGDVGAAAEDPSISRGLRYLPLLLVAAVAMLAAMPLLTFLQRPTLPPGPPVVHEVVPDPPAPAGLAVLPFQNYGSGGPDAPLVAGIHAEIVAELSKISDLRVIARSSVLRLRDDPRGHAEIAADLGVDAIAAGTVHRRDDELRITVELVDVPSEELLWSDVYERTLTSANVFAVESEVAMQIAKALDAQLSSDELDRILADPSTSFEAYELYQLGRYNALLNTRGGFEKSVAYLEGALAKDPAFALAHAALGHLYVLAAVEGWMPEREAYQKARLSARRALDDDAELAPAHALLCRVKTQHEWAWAAAETRCKQAVALMPGDAQSRRTYAALLAVRCRLREAMDEVQVAMRLDPVSGLSHLAAARLHWYAREYDAAAELAAEALRHDPSLGRGYRFLGLTRLFAGGVEEGLMYLERHAQHAGRSPLSLSVLGYGYAVAGLSDRARDVLVELDRSDAARPVDRAIVELGLGRNDLALGALERAVDDRASLMVLLGLEPMFDPLRDDPRFDQLLTRVGLESCSDG